MNEFTVGREPIQLVEIYQPSCSLTYGVGACTAVLGVTNNHKCFNTSKTCQDKPNYTPDNSIVWRFTKPMAHRPLDIFEDVNGTLKSTPIPSLLSVSTNPTKINVGGGNTSQSPFGTRASVNISLTDHQYDDSIGDLYLSERTYKAFNQGTFWGKWLARNPYYDGYKCIVYDGYIGQTLAEMVKRTYLITAIDFNGSLGTVRIVAKDPLDLADDDKAQAPLAAELSLKTAIDAVQTTGISLLGDVLEVSKELGNTGTTRYIRMSDEILSYTGYTESPVGDMLLSGVVRGVLNTIADEQDIEESAQRCIRYNSMPVYDIAYDLLINHTDVPSAYIPYAKWEAEGSVYLTPFTLSATITEPMGVNELLGELTEQCLFYIWWDERTEEILLEAIRPTTVPVVALDDTYNILAGSFSVKVEPKERISRCVVYHGMKDPTEKIDEVGNYGLVRVHVNTDAEGIIQYNNIVTRTIHSRWLSTKAQATQLAVRLVARYGATPRKLKLKMDAKDRNTWLSHIASIEHASMQDEQGENLVERWQVISASEVVHGETVEYEFQSYEFGASQRFAYIMANNAPDFSTDYYASIGVGMWYADASGEMPNGSDGFLLQ